MQDLQVDGRPFRGASQESLMARPKLKVLPVVLPLARLPVGIVTLKNRRKIRNSVTRARSTAAMPAVGGPAIGKSVMGDCLYGSKQKRTCLTGVAELSTFPTSRLEFPREAGTEWFDSYMPGHAVVR